MSAFTHAGGRTLASGVGFTLTTDYTIFAGTMGIQTCCVCTSRHAGIPIAIAGSPPEQPGKHENLSDPSTEDTT